MEFFYAFENVSLTQHILLYLIRKVRSHLDCVTVIFLNDRWVMHLKLDRSTQKQHYDNCRAVFNELGVPCQISPAIALALQELDAGYIPTLVMNRHQVVIVSHGEPKPDEIRCFQEQFVAGLGYCPPSLV